MHFDTPSRDEPLIRRFIETETEIIRFVWKL